MSVVPDSAYVISIPAAYLFINIRYK